MCVPDSPTPLGTVTDSQAGVDHSSSTPSTHLQDQLHHLRVHQPMHRLPVDVSDEVALTKPCLTGGTPVLHVLPQGENSSQFWPVA